MRELTDYGSYHMSLAEEMKCIGISVVLAALAAWILYKSPWGLVLIVFILPLMRKNYMEKCIDAGKRELLRQFKDGIQSVSVALLAGYSIEKAWIEAEKEMSELYGTKAVIVGELRQLNAAVRVNQPIEQALEQFAQRTHCEDIIGFSEVFGFAKRSGGNFAKIMQHTVQRIAEKIETEREIETVLSGKKMEQKVMNIVPVCLLAYLNVTSEEFLAPLYGNVFGVCVMTLAFCTYVSALMWAQKLTNIEV